MENLIQVKVISPPRVLNRICLNSSAVNYSKDRQVSYNLVKLPTSLTTLKVIALVMSTLKLFMTAGERTKLPEVLQDPVSKTKIYSIGNIVNSTVW